MPALLVADRPNWVYDRKAHIFQSLSRRFDVEIGYVCTDDPARLWPVLHEKRRYAIVWMHGFRMGHDPVNRYNEPLAEFVRHQNAQGTAVVATVSNSLLQFPLPRPGTFHQNGPATRISRIEWELGNASHAEEVNSGGARCAADDAERLRIFNGVSVNNKFALARLGHVGVEARFVPDGVNLNIFRCVRPVSERPFRVLFVSSLKKQEHKGIAIFRALSEQLLPEGIACQAILADSSSNFRTPETMCEIYNAFPIFVCASRAEGGPATMLEAAACGCVPISTPVGYAADVIGRANGYIVRRELHEFVAKVLHLRKHPELLSRMSERVQRAVRPCDWSLRVEHYEQFLLDHLLIPHGGSI